MQAPTTSGTQAQEPGLRICPGCGAVNGPTVGFCWQCFRAFDGSVAPAASEGSVVPVPPPPSVGGPRGAWAPPPVLTPVPVGSERNVGAMIGMAMLALALVAGVVVYLNRGPGVELPGSIGGVSQVRGAEVELLLDQFHAEADRQGVDADMALYGSSGIPSIGLVWVKDASVPTTEDAFDAFATGFNEGLGIGSLDESRATTSLVEGVTYVCAPVGITPPANICVWEEDEVFWVLFDLSGTSSLSATQDLAVTARASAAA